MTLLVGTAGDGDHACAGLLAELDRRAPDAAGGAEHEQRLTRGERAAPMQGDVRGLERDEGRDRVGVGDRVGHAVGTVGRDDRPLRETAVREIGDANDALADHVRLDAVTHGVDRARGLEPEHERALGADRVRTAAHHHVGQVGGGRADPHPDAGRVPARARRPRRPAAPRPARLARGLVLLAFGGEG